jgi:hypothetical protein
MRMGGDGDMKNSDMPAMPAPYHVYRDLIESNFHGTSLPIAGMGLTKREMLAMAAMQGLCASNGYNAFNLLAQDAVTCADALLAALEAKQ